jgi:hypothetical protein
MKDRHKTLAAIAGVLHKMDELSQEMSKPGVPLESVREEWHRQEMKYQALMDQLAQLPYETKQVDGVNGV